MRLTINGRERMAPEGLTLASLVRELSLEGLPIAVELNGAVVPKNRYGVTLLKGDDRLEIITLVGGG